MTLPLNNEDNSKNKKKFFSRAFLPYVDDWLVLLQQETFRHNLQTDAFYNTYGYNPPFDIKTQLTIAPLQKSDQIKCQHA